MVTPSDQAWKEYQQAIDRVRSPAGAGVERASGISASTAPSELDKVVATSEQLRIALAEAVTTKSASERDLAGMKLMAAAVYDLSLAQELFERGDAAEAVTERSAAAVFADPGLRAILDAPLEGGMTSLVTERSAAPPDPAAARAGLLKSVEQFVTDIPKRSAKIVLDAIAGAGNFGFGPAQELLSAITQEVAAQVPQALSTFVSYAVKLVREAVLKLWDAFGKEKQTELENESRSWFKKLLDKPDIAAALLGQLYQVDALRKDIAAAIDRAPASTSAGKLNEATQQLDELLARHEKLVSTLGWVVRGIGWAKTPLLAVPPWGPAAAYGVYVGVVGYAIYTGGDYLDAKGFAAAWLDHVQGARAIIHAI
jgi:hypothetical protein